MPKVIASRRPLYMCLNGSHSLYFAARPHACCDVQEWFQCDTQRGVTVYVLAQASTAKRDAAEYSLKEKTAMFEQAAGSRAATPGKL